MNQYNPRIDKIKMLKNENQLLTRESIIIRLPVVDRKAVQTSKHLRKNDITA